MSSGSILAIVASLSTVESYGDIRTRKRLLSNALTAVLRSRRDCAILPPTRS
jgi:hypothetical protein